MNFDLKRFEQSKYGKLDHSNYRVGLQNAKEHADLKPKHNLKFYTITDGNFSKESTDRAMKYIKDYLNFEEKSFPLREFYIFGFDNYITLTRLSNEARSKLNKDGDFKHTFFKLQSVDQDQNVFEETMAKDVQKAI